MNNVGSTLEICQDVTAVAITWEELEFSMAAVVIKVAAAVTDAFRVSSVLFTMEVGKGGGTGGGGNGADEDGNGWECEAFIN